MLNKCTHSFASWTSVQMSVCMGPCDGLVSNPGCFPAAHPGYLGYDPEPLQLLKLKEWIYKECKWTCFFLESAFAKLIQWIRTKSLHLQLKLSEKATKAMEKNVRSVLNILCNLVVAAITSWLPQAVTTTPWAIVLILLQDGLINIKLH